MAKEAATRIAIDKKIQKMEVIIYFVHTTYSNIFLLLNSGKYKPGDGSKNTEATKSQNIYNKQKNQETF